MTDQKRRKPPILRGTSSKQSSTPAQRKNEKDRKRFKPKPGLGHNSRDPAKLGRRIERRAKRREQQEIGRREAQWSEYAKDYAEAQKIAASSDLRWAFCRLPEFTGRRSTSRPNDSERGSILFSYLGLINRSLSASSLSLLRRALARPFKDDVPAEDIPALIKMHKGIQRMAETERQRERAEGESDEEGAEPKRNVRASRSRKEVKWVSAYCLNKPEPASVNGLDAIQRKKLANGKAIEVDGKIIVSGWNGVLRISVPMRFPLPPELPPRRPL